MYVFFLWICVLTTSMAHMNQKEGINPLELELVGFKPPYGSWEPNLVPSAITSAVNIWAVSPLLSFPFLFSFLFKILNFYVYETLPTCNVCFGCLQNLEENIRSLKLKFQMTVNYYVCSKPNQAAFARRVSALKCWATSLVSYFCFVWDGVLCVVLAKLELPV